MRIDHPGSPETTFSPEGIRSIVQGWPAQRGLPRVRDAIYAILGAAAGFASGCPKTTGE